MATKIQNLATTQLTLASHVQFHTEVNALITELTPVKLHLDTQAPLYAAAVTAEADVVNRPTAYAETQQMREADHERDMAISLVFNLVDAYSASTRGIKVRNALTVQAALKPYRGIQAHEMNRQTTETDGLIADLCEDPVRKAMNDLLIQDTIEELIDANQMFKSATTARDAEALRRQPITEADSKELRANTDNLYRQIVEQTNAYAIIQPSEDITAFISRMNVLVAKYKTVIANQGKSKADAPATEVAQ